MSQPLRRSRVAVGAVALLVAAGLSTSAAQARSLPVPLGASIATPAPAGTENVCGTAAPGQARCLSLRRVSVSEPLALSWHPHAAVPSVTPSGYGPADLAAAYALDTTRGSGQTVAIVDAYDSPTAESDLAVYRTQYGLPACTRANGCFRKVNQNGGASPLPAANSGWAMEIALDVDMVSATCPQCSILLVEANSSYLSDLGTAEDTAVSLGARFVSNSYGGGDGNGGASHFDHPGVAITASTGDNGYGVSFPASAPTVTAVGGTSLRRAATTRGWNDTVWSGAGSGCSAAFGKPAFQNSVSTGCANRAVADVSAVADPYTGVAVYLSGGWTVLGGTSASSPIIASVYALAGTPGSTDYPNSYPYRYSDRLNDVTSGSNGSCGGSQLCTARTGWDGPTGFGTPNGPSAFSSTGVAGPPTTLGATATVTGPVLAGLASTATVLPQLPTGDAVASIGWKAARTDCAFSDPAAASTQLSCSAAATGSTTVTVTVTDTAHAVKAVTVPITFASSARRAVTVSATLAGQSGASQNVCTSAASPLQAAVLDVATGLPVKGISVAFSRQSGSTAPVGLASGSTGASGLATSSLITATAVSVGAHTSAAGLFDAASATGFAVSAAKCTPALTVTAGKSSIYYGDSVVLSGQLSRAAPAGSLPLAGAPVQLTETVAGRVLLLGSTLSAADGRFSATVKPTASGSLGAALAANTSWSAAAGVAGSLTVNVATSALSAQASATDVGYAAPVVVSGTLSRNAGGVIGPLGGGTVSVRGTSGTGVVSVLGSALSASDGSWKLTVLSRVSTTLSASYAGSPAQQPSTANIGALTVGTWTPALTLTTQFAQQVAGASNVLTGSVTRSYGGATVSAASVPIRIYLLTSTGASTLLASSTTSTAGVFRLAVAPTENGSLVARIVGLPGYLDASSPSVALVVSTKVVVSAPAYAVAAGTVAVTVSVSVPRVAVVSLERWTGTAWNTVGTAATSASGVVRFTMPAGVAGSLSLRVTTIGDSRGGAGASTSATVTVR